MPDTWLPCIVTLKLDVHSFETFNTLRQRYFPPERNFLSAHITLFHALPRDQEASLRTTCQAIAAQTTRLSLTFPNLRLLGKGVAVRVESPELQRVRQHLAHQWDAWLTPQDRQTYQPHITLQNKVMPEMASQLYNDLSTTWEPLEGYGEGLLLWYYQGGPWTLAGDYSFIE